MSLHRPSRVFAGFVAFLFVSLTSVFALRDPTAYEMERKRPRPERAPAVDERQVLLEAAAVLSEDPSSQLSSWSADNPDDLCRWEGVTCGDDGRVFELYLRGGGLSGRIPSILCFLDKLTALHLPNNNLGGAIPAELGACRHLTLLDLEDNKITGTIPPELAGTRLVDIFLSHNLLSGTIPPELSSLNVNHLHLEHNRITGTIPPELAVTTLMDIYLSHNLLTGTIPPELSSLHDLYNLHLNDNKLTGTIPSAFSTMSIEEFAVQNNYLSGDLEKQLQSLGQWWSPDYMDMLKFYPQHAKQ
eukprot:jgi/Tetstr1/425449/TSEL_015896.t1